MSRTQHSKLENNRLKARKIKIWKKECNKKTRHKLDLGNFSQYKKNHYCLDHHNW